MCKSQELSFELINSSRDGSFIEMCEWLSCEEWCDVFLLCGGRVFSAHRAVLASVSKFLRKILLSCPVDESPTFIVMPEFDFETMSSALHYIYNGEVAIGKHQVDTFLDIMYALQVFVDTRDLNKHSKINNYALIEDKCTLDRENISLRGKDNVILKKEVTTKTNIKFSYNNINSDQSNLDSSCYKSKRIWTGYLKSHANRRSQPFSRDLFIETYNLDRNVNGVTEGVLAIPNEYYREPASLLKTNANAEHLGEVHSDTDHKIVTEEHLNDSLYDLEHFEVKKEDSNYVDISLNNNNIENNNIPKNNLFKNIQDEISKKSIHEEQTYSINNNLISKHSLNLDTKDVEDACSSASEISTEFNKSRDNINRVTILNEVLQSPWRPRLSLTFTPGSKKCINLKAENEKSLQSKQNGVSIDDRNNNNNVSSKAENSNEAESNENEMKRNGNKDVFAHKDEDMRRHNATQYTCTECHKSFSQLRNYKYHMSVHRGTKEFSTTCPVCGKFFNDKGYLSSHMKIHRNRKEYKCSSCPKSFNQRVAYNMHVRIHTGVKPHVCEECGKAFSRKMLLKQHQRTHSGERPYSCQHCNKRFADRSNMTLHLRLHTGVKPFACSLCPKSFTKKHHLKSHLNFHTGDKPYTCPRCKLAFTQSSNMRTHMKKCNVDKE